MTSEGANEGETTGAAQETLHLLPCEIQFTGPVDVGQYFQPTPTAATADSTTTLLESTFQGRRLYGDPFVQGSHSRHPQVTLGRPVVIPDGYQGHLVQSNDGEQQQQESLKFKEIVYWTRDAPPALHNVLSRAMEWPQVALAVSSSKMSVLLRDGLLCGAVESTNRPERLCGMTKSSLPLCLVLLLTLCASQLDAAASRYV